MGYFKKFTDFCAGVCAFVAALFIMRQYMIFKPQTAAEYFGTDNPTEEAPGKLKQFLTISKNNNHLLVIILVVLIVAAIILCRILRKHALPCFIISMFPSMQIFYMLSVGSLFEQQGLFLAIAILLIAGNIVDAVLLDKDDGRHRVCVISRASVLMASLFCVTVLILFSLNPPTTVALNAYQKDLYLNVTEQDIIVISISGIIFALMYWITLWLKDVYFIDAILSFVPTVYIVWQVFAENLTFARGVFLFIAIANTLIHITLAIFENNLPTDEQIKLRQTAEEVIDA